MIPSTFLTPVEVRIRHDGHDLGFLVSASRTEHVAAGLRLWIIAVKRHCRATFLIGWLPQSAFGPTPDELAHLLDAALTNAAQADMDLLSMAFSRGLSQDDAAREVSQSRAHAAGLELLSISPKQAGELALSLAPEIVRPEFLEVL